jgi:hypothetical protein
MKHGMPKRIAHKYWWWNNKEYIDDKNYNNPEHPIVLRPGSEITISDRTYVIDTHGAYIRTNTRSL